MRETKKSDWQRKKNLGKGSSFAEPHSSEPLIFPEMPPRKKIKRNVQEERHLADKAFREAPGYAAYNDFRYAQRKEIACREAMVAAQEAHAEAKAKMDEARNGSFDLKALTELHEAYVKLDNEYMSDLRFACIQQNWRR